MYSVGSQTLGSNVWVPGSIPNEIARTLASNPQLVENVLSSPIARAAVNNPQLVGNVLNSPITRAALANPELTREVLNSPIGRQVASNLLAGSPGRTPYPRGPVYVSKPNDDSLKISNTQPRGTSYQISSANGERLSNGVVGIEPIRYSMGSPVYSKEAVEALIATSSPARLSNGLTVPERLSNGSAVSLPSSWGYAPVSPRRLSNGYSPISNGSAVSLPSSWGYAPVSPRRSLSNDYVAPVLTAAALASSPAAISALSPRNGYTPVSPRRYTPSSPRVFTEEIIGPGYTEEIFASRSPNPLINQWSKTLPGGYANGMSYHNKHSHGVEEYKKKEVYRKTGCGCGGKK
ncbi:hypothetical protein D3C87_982520 [compost metagenome]